MARPMRPLSISFWSQLPKKKCTLLQVVCLSDKALEKCARHLLVDLHIRLSSPVYSEGEAVREQEEEEASVV